MMDINPDTIIAVSRYYDRLLCHRHMTVPMPFKAEHINRLMCTKEEWNYVSWMLDNRPESLHYADHVVIPPELFGFPEMTLPMLTAMEEPPAKQVRVLVRFAMDDEYGREKVAHPAPRKMLVQPSTDNETRQKVRTGSRLCTTNFIDHDYALYPKFRAWAAAHYKITYENLLAYGLLQHVMSECSTWLQVKKLWPELTNDLQHARSICSTLFGRVPDLRERDAKRARNISYVVAANCEKYRKRVIPTFVNGNLLQSAFHASGGFRKTRSSDAPPWLRNRAVYPMSKIASKWDNLNGSYDHDYQGFGDG